MRWIKASERLPEEKGWYCLKNISPDGFKWYDGITFVFNNKPMEGFHDGVVWLDESESSSPLPLKDGQREPGCTCNFDYSGEPLIGGYARCSVHSPDKNYDKEELEHFLKKAAPKQSSPLKDIVQEMENHIIARNIDDEATASVLKYYMNKLKLIYERSDWETFWKEAQGCIKYSDPSLEELKSKYHLILK